MTPTKLSLLEQQQLDQLFSAQNYQGLLAWLNHQGRHRYTGLFKYEPSGMHNALLFDREDAGVTRLSEAIPLDASYCSFVCQSENIFLVVDASEDPRTLTHPSRDAVKSYCGVPIYDPAGKLWGTLCYYAPDANHVTPEQIERLVAVGKRLQAGVMLDAAAHAG